MNEIEIGTFIDHHLKALWPEWAPTDIEVCDWKIFLGGLDFDKAVKSFAFWRTSRKKGKGREPLIAFLRPAMERARLDHGTGGQEWVEVYRIRRHGGIGRPFMAKSMPSPPECLRQAEAMQARYVETYGGEWEIVRLWEDNMPESGLRGEEAEQAVFDKILAGPACKKQRWVLRLLDRRATKESRAVEQRKGLLANVVRIGDVVGDIPL